MRPPAGTPCGRRVRLGRRRRENALVAAREAIKIATTCSPSWGRLCLTFLLSVCPLRPHPLRALCPLYSLLSLLSLLSLRLFSLKLFTVVSCFPAAPPHCAAQLADRQDTLCVHVLLLRPPLSSSTQRSLSCIFLLLLFSPSGRHSALHNSASALCRPIASFVRCLVQNCVPGGCETVQARAGIPSKIVFVFCHRHLGPLFSFTLLPALFLLFSSPKRPTSHRKTPSPRSQHSKRHLLGWEKARAARPFTRWKGNGLLLTFAAVASTAAAADFSPSLSFW